MIDPKNIVLRLPNWLGDAVMASPVITLIKKRWPKAKLTLFGTESSLALFKHDPSADEFFILNKRESPFHHIYKLRDMKFDCAILLTHSFSSAWLFFRAHIPDRIGFSKDMRKWLLTETIPYPKDSSKEHHIKTYQRLMNQLGIDEEGVPELFISDEEAKWADSFLHERGIADGDLLIAINPSASYGPSKCWIEDYFHQVSERLVHEKKAHLIFIGDSKAYEKNNRICFGMENVFNLAGKTSIRELMALLKRCDLLLTNDSGPMHIACALDVPVVALFGSTSPKATGPYNKSIYIYKKVECSPCYKRECPIDFPCMKKIKPNEVYQAIESQLNQYSKKTCPTKSFS